VGKGKEKRKGGGGRRERKKSLDVGVFKPKEEKGGKRR